jgi:hypothetical protein
MLLAGVLVLGHAPVVMAQQTLNFSLGYFTVRGEDARVEGDVLNVNRTFLTFDVGEFNGPAIGAEWLVPLGRFVEGGIGVGFSRRTVASVYTEFVDDDGTEIDQDLRLRLVPMAFTVRVVPTSVSSPVQPYFGAGLGIINWRYSESGEFVDFGAGRVIFQDQFVATGSETGPVVLGGIRFAGDSATGGFEIRYHSAEGELDDSVFESNRIDLGGWTYNFTVGFRF